MRSLFAGINEVSARSPFSVIWKVSVSVAPGKGVYRALGASCEARPSDCSPSVLGISPPGPVSAAGREANCWSAISSTRAWVRVWYVVSMLTHAM